MAKFASCEKFGWGILYIPIIFTVIPCFSSANLHMFSPLKVCYCNNIMMVVSLRLSIIHAMMSYRSQAPVLSPFKTINVLASYFIKKAF